MLSFSFLLKLYLYNVFTCGQDEFFRPVINQSACALLLSDIIKALSILLKTILPIVYLHFHLVRERSTYFVECEEEAAFAFRLDNLRLSNLKANAASSWAFCFHLHASDKSRHQSSRHLTKLL